MRSLLPDLARIATLFAKHHDHFLSNWWATFSVAALASVGAFAISTGLALAAVRWRPIDLLMLPLAAMSQSFPLQAVAPLIVIVVGSGTLSKLVIALVIAFFPMYGAAVTALRQTSTPLLAFARTCQATPTQSMLLVRLPAALPSLVSAAKVGFTLAVLGTVVAEFISPDRGIGVLLLIAQSNYDVDVIYACIGLLMFQGVTIYGCMSLIEARLLRRWSV